MPLVRPILWQVALQLHRVVEEARNLHIVLAYAVNEKVPRPLPVAGDMVRPSVGMYFRVALSSLRILRERDERFSY